MGVIEARMLDLYVEEPVLGADSRFYREAGVLFGKATVVPAGDDELPNTSQRRIDRGSQRFDLITIPLHLEELEHGQYYVDARVRVTFDQPEVLSVRLMKPAGPAESHVTITASGSGLSELSWRLTCGGDDGPGLVAGGRELSAIVESPLPGRRVTGKFDARVRFVRRTARRVRAKEAEAREPLPFSLDFGKRSFEFDHQPTQGAQTV